METDRSSPYKRCSCLRFRHKRHIAYQVTHQGTRPPAPPEKPAWDVGVAVTVMLGVPLNTVPAGYWFLKTRTTVPASENWNTFGVELLRGLRAGDLRRCGG